MHFCTGKVVGPKINSCDFQARPRGPKGLRAESAGLLLAVGTPTVGGGKTFWGVSQIFLRKQL